MFLANILNKSAPTKLLSHRLLVPVTTSLAKIHITSSLRSSNYNTTNDLKNILSNIPRRNISSVLSRKLREDKDYELPPPQNEDEGFAKLGIRSEFTQLLVSQNITNPTGVQELAIPRLLQNGDGAIGAQTGTGKTLAFVLPIVQQLVRDEQEKGITTRSQRPRALIVVPSRELALQIVAVAKSMCHHPNTRFRAAAVIGGENKLSQKRILEGEESYHAVRAKNLLAKKEKQKVIELAIVASRVARKFGVDKTSARRLSNKFAWELYLEHLGRYTGLEVDFEDIPDNARAYRDVGYKHAMDVATNKRALTKAFDTDNGRTVECVMRIVNAHDQVVEEAAVIEELHTYLAENETVEEVDIADVEQDIDELDHHEEVVYDDDSDADLDLSYHKSLPNVKPTPEQILRQHRNVDLLVGTPGRIKSLIDDEQLFLSDVRYIAVDEADFMFHPQAGFTEELNQIFTPIRKRLNNNFISKYGFAPSSGLSGTELIGNHSVRQMESHAAKLKAGVNHIPTNVFNTQLIFAGASLGGEFLNTVKNMFPLYTENRFTRPLHKLETRENLCLPKHLQQTWVRVGNKDKLQILSELLSNSSFLNHDDPNFKHPTSVMIFCNSISSCRAVQHHLTSLDISVVGSHGEVPARLRRQYWSEFLGKNKAVMVATDMSARGIDTRFLSRVINFDFPMSPVDYLHRAGRVGRSTDAGHVINLLIKGDEVLAKAIDNAHKSSSPITMLSSDKDAYRTDVALELRKDADIISGVSKRRIMMAKQTVNRKQTEQGDERRDIRRQAKDDEKLKRSLMSMPWQKKGGNVTGRIFTGGQHRYDDFNSEAKKGQLKRVFRDIKTNNGDRSRKVDKTSDARKREAQELAMKTRFAKAKGVDEPILSKTQSIKTMMSDKAIREKIEYTLKQTREKKFKKDQREKGKSRNGFNKGTRYYDEEYNPADFNE